ncbi:hypothetical protein JVT61DRAFT_7853 [Boletus reticuloceps]|uniref:DUF6830 domain-containing protein n=1 Tax=Boletus reticuloceps TaxID=495285 RepID=A0A8I2YJG1_9AGAM|nr:hypothetical protein JVT61DRAFT_7853 [Boletus reticuloceps]
MKLSRTPVNYFTITDALTSGFIPDVLKPCRTFSTSTTTFHLAIKPSLHMSIDAASDLFRLPDLHPTISEFLQCIKNHMNHPISGVTSQDLHVHFP